MIKTTAMLLEELRSYSAPANKLQRLVNKGEITPIVRGLYETNAHTAPHLLAGSIYGPSYISFEFALSFYGLIPETVHTVTCATFEKGKRKNYQTPFGAYTYRDVPSKAFPFFLSTRQEGEYYYRIASPEKAICDQLYSLPPIPNRTTTEEVLFNDLRIDSYEWSRLDFRAILSLENKYHSTNIKQLCSYIKRSAT